MELIRLNKFLAHSGIGSRRKVEELIFSKVIKVNDKIIDTPFTMIDPKKDVVKVNNKVVRLEKKHYFILNKPKGFLCSNERKAGEKLVTDLFKDYSCKFLVIGRLDKNTTGLVIVTNDGEFVNKVTHPSSNLEKEYIADVSESITSEHIKNIQRGGYIDNKFVKPKEVIKTKRKTLKIVVKDNQKREAKILIERANLTLLELKRVRYGNLNLSSIPYGYFKVATLEEVEKIF